MSLDFWEENYEDPASKYYSSNTDSTLVRPPEDEEDQFNENDPSTYSGIGDEAEEYLKNREENEDSDETDGGFYKPGPKSSAKKLAKNAALDGIEVVQPELAPVVYLAKHKNKVFIGGGGLFAVIGIIMLLFFIGSQKLPGFAALIASQSMARANRIFQRDTTELTSEEAALEAESPADQAILENTTYSNSATGGLLAKLKSYSPNDVMDNLKSSGVIKFNYGPAEEGVGKFLGAQKLKSVTVGGEDYLVSDIAPSTWGFARHPITTFGNRATAVSDLMDSIGSLDTDGGLLIRFGLGRQIISELGGNPLAGIFSSRFADKSASDSSAILDQQAEDAISPTSDPVIIPETDGIANATRDADQQLTTDGGTLEGVKAIDANGGNDPKVNSIIDDESKSLTSGLLSKISISYAIAVPACIIYDSSLQSPNASKSINKQTDEVKRSYLLVQSAASQQKSGALSGNAIQAFNNKLGNLSSSNPEIVANGGSPDTLSSIVSPQAGPGGQYSIVDTLMPSVVAQFIDPIATTVCPVLTNSTVAIGILAAQVVSYIAGVITGGISDAAEAAAQISAKAAADAAVNSVDDEVATAVVSKETEVISENTVASEVSNNLTTSVLGNFLKMQSRKVYEFVDGAGGITGVVKQGAVTVVKKSVSVGAVVGATYGLAMLAHEVVAQDMGTTYDGYSQGNDFANQSAAGGQAFGSEMVQKQYFGVPLEPTALAYNQNLDNTNIAKVNSTGSMYQRYLATANPYSLVSKLSLNVYATITNFSLNTFVSKLASLFNPIRVAESLTSVFNKKAAAASTQDNGSYGLVEWGYTPQEDALTNPATGDPSYQPLENAKILNSPANAAKISYISSVYNACYTSDMGTLLTQKPSLGPDTSDVYINRDKNGNVDGGLCTEKYLGPNSSDPQAADGKYGNDLIFRWRLSQSYTQSLDVLSGVQHAV
jgi:hypothetical protein